MVIVRSENSFTGFLTLGSRKYAFEIIPDDTRPSRGSFKLDWRLKNLLGDSLNTFLNGNVFEDPVQFYNEFVSFVKKKLDKKEKCESWLQNPLRTCSLVKCLMEEIASVKYQIKSLDIENGIVEIEEIDSQLRIHKVVLRLSQNYQREPIIIISHDLPLQKTDLFQNSTDLNNIFSVSEFCKKFSQLVAQFQKFWDTVAIVDSQCCVLDPARPTYKDVFRRIKVKDTLSIVLTFNPFLAEQRPLIKLLGCQSDVNYYQAILQNSFENDLWDCDEDLLYNISNTLQVTLPSKIEDEEMEASDVADSEECAICFTWRLNNEIPNEVCEKPTCKSIYHSTCLFTYLSSLLRNRDYFGKIQGECPNCDEVISCNVPKFI